MFILCELRNRAETVDTILLYASNSKEVLEKKREEMYEWQLKYAEILANNYEYKDIDKLREWCSDRMRNFHIVEIPYIEE